MKPTFLLTIVAGLVALTVVVEEVSAAVPLCPHCVCPPSYSPVCGYRKSTNTTMYFPSRCVLDCTNKCRRVKFEFVFNGRCEKWVSSTVTGSPTTPQSAPRNRTAPWPLVPAYYED